MYELSQRDIITLNDALTAARRQVADVAEEPGYFQQYAIEEVLVLERLSSLFRGLEFEEGPSYQLVPVPEGTTE